jgi:hypothetical protein
LNLLHETDDNDLKGKISFALVEIGEKAVESLLNLLHETDDNLLKRGISDALENLNPLYLYPFMENQILKPAILNVLYRLSKRFNIRFFKDKVVLSEGDILHIKTEVQREQAIKKLDKILK